MSSHTDKDSDSDSSTITSYSTTTSSSQSIQQPFMRLVTRNDSSSSSLSSMSLLSPVNNYETTQIIYQPLSNDNNRLYSSTITLTKDYLSKTPPPPPPVRRTSTLSNPNAITIGTLRNAGVSTYEEIRAIKKQIQASKLPEGKSINVSEANEAISVKSANAINTAIITTTTYSNIKCKEVNDANVLEKIVNKGKQNENNCDDLKDEKLDYQQVKALFENLQISKANLTEERLPTPPPEAFSLSDAEKTTCKKISALRRDFIDSLNTKLSHSQVDLSQSKLVKRRSISLSRNEQDWDSDSGLGCNSSIKSRAAGNSNTRNSSVKENYVQNKCLPNNSLSNLNSSQLSNSTESSIYSSTQTLRANKYGKPPPLPPVRKTSSISNPNAITLGTLRNAGVSTYEEIKTLKRNGNYRTYEDISKLGLNNEKEEQTEPSESHYSSINVNSKEENHSDVMNRSFRKEYMEAKLVFEKLTKSKTAQNENEYQNQKELESEEPPLPPPPPEAYSDSEAYSHNHNKIANIRKDFLQTLNAKLSTQRNLTGSPQLTKRRSMSLSYSEHEWDSDSGIVTNCSSISSSSQGQIIQKSLMKLISGQSSPCSTISSGSSNRYSSPEAFRKTYNYLSIYNGKNNQDANHMQSLQHQLVQQQQLQQQQQQQQQLQHQHNNQFQQEISKYAIYSVNQMEVAKAAVEALNKRNVHHFQTTNLNNQRQENLYVNGHVNHQIYCNNNNNNINNNNNNKEQFLQRQQYQFEEHNQRQQEIYLPVQNLQQNTKYVRRSSQPSMGIKLSTVRQQHYQNQQIKDKAAFMASLDATLSQQRIYSSSVTSSPILSKRGSSGDLSVKENLIQLAKQHNHHSHTNLNNVNNTNCKTAMKTRQVNNLHSGLLERFENAIAARVHNWLSSRGSVDVITCRESLLGQIRQGVELRKTPISNDRSAPNIY